MAEALLLAWSNVIGSEAEAEFHQWYDRVHVPQLRAAIPSIMKVRRYRTEDPDGPAAAGPPLHRYLAVYELDSADVTAAAAALAAAAAEGRFDATATMDLVDAPPAVQWLTAL